ncbi:MAG: hypothetical protein IKS76_01615 [Paludibacteraceae bacterium]|nr:hypothetical protein [Paludibacteraceae bacterium]
MAEYVTQAQLVQAVAQIEQNLNTVLAGLEVLQPAQGEYVTNQQAVELIENTVDTWGDLLWDILMRVTHLIDDINGEVVYDNLVQKILYLAETKRLIKVKIGSRMPEDTRFRDYPNYIDEGGAGVITPLVANFNGVYDATQLFADGYNTVTVAVEGYTKITTEGIDRTQIPYVASTSVE